VLKYDTVMGIFPKEVHATVDAMDVDENKVVMTDQRDPAAIPWKDLGVDIVIESIGVFRKRLRERFPQLVNVQYSIVIYLGCGMLES
jgi:glyceraldehyde-3-phosphate dehydrogenase/erythrose-4-phosphate dehydrogenase